MVRYTVNIQKSKHFCTLTMKIKKQKLRGKTPFPRAKRKVKYLRINLTKQLKNTYTENYETLMK